MRPFRDAYRDEAAGMTRVTIVGSGTSAPQPDTPASGILIETASTAFLVDCGQGVIRGLMPVRDPRELDAIIVGHLHADHYIDVVSLRYLMPWDGFTGRRLPLLLPPGGRQRMAELASAISERPGFFDHTFEVTEYDPAAALAIGDLTVTFVPGRHYVPAWGCAIVDGSGHRVVISGDTGPQDALIEAARGAELFIVEATLLNAGEDDPARGHLTVDEALEIGAQAGVAQTVLVHYRPQNRDVIDAACLDRRGAFAGHPGLTFEVPAVEPVVRGRADNGIVADGRAAVDGQPGVEGSAVPDAAAGVATEPATGIASSAFRARSR
jgi:ribonuclease BN (tRNA processing enzyme)